MISFESYLFLKLKFFYLDLLLNYTTLPFKFLCSPSDNPWVNSSCDSPRIYLAGAMGHISLVFKHKKMAPVDSLCWQFRHTRDAL